MLDIHALERRWLKYKIKSYLPYGAGLILLAGIVVGSVWWIGSPHTVAPLANPRTEVNTSQVEHVDNTLPAPSIPEEQTRLEPSMDFVHSFQTAPDIASPTQVTPPPATPKPTPIQQSQPPVPKTLAMPELPQPISVSSGDKEDPKTLAINRNENKLDINEVQSRFKETSNANLGVFIARYHYDHGNYLEAYNYALKTNTLNNRLDESWLIFAKSLVKLGKSDQAKRTLQVYISQSGSESAKELLNAIEKGNFK